MLSQVLKLLHSEFGTQNGGNMMAIVKAGPEDWLLRTHTLQTNKQTNLFWV